MSRLSLTILRDAYMYNCDQADILCLYLVLLVPLLFSEQRLHHIQLSKVLHRTVYSSKLQWGRRLVLSHSPSNSSVCVFVCFFMWSLQLHGTDAVQV